MASAEVPSIYQTRRVGTGAYCTSAPVPSFDGLADILCFAHLPTFPSTSYERRLPHISQSIRLSRGSKEGGSFRISAGL